MKDKQSGIGKLTALVFGPLAVAFVYSVYCIIPFYYSYFELQNQMASLIAIADTHNDAQLRTRVMQVIRELGIPADAKDVLIDRRDRIIKFNVEYEEIFYVPLFGKDYDIHTFEFSAEAEGPF